MQTNGQKADIGVWGLGVMGRNLALNIAEKGYRTAVYNRAEAGEEEVVDKFLQEEAQRKPVAGTTNIEKFVGLLKKPRKIIMMVPSGNPVEQVIEQLKPHLDRKDIIIDGGNSHFEDTNRRLTALRNHGIRFMGMGISGGEEGARHGPALMPGGDETAWNETKEIFSAIDARSPQDQPCCNWIGPEGAGHFVKMVHNGIEYADMQLIAECYHIMKEMAGMSHNEMAGVFQTWNSGPASSYLTEITADILLKADADGEPLLEKILDVAGQKGTGKWTAETALDEGIATPVIHQAVTQRFLSAFTQLRENAHQTFDDPQTALTTPRNELLHQLEQAFLASRIMAHHEGFLLIREASINFEWSINLAEVARTWQGGCIIRSLLLQDIEAEFSRSADTLLGSELFIERLNHYQEGWRQIISQAVKHGVPVPALSSALSAFDSYRVGRLPVNLIQAQRDYFGAHTYERVDQPRGTFFHTEWKSKED